MANEKLSVVTEVAATPGQVYEAWLDSKLHSAMTGGRASVVARVGGRHSAWNGYISGKIVDLQAGLRIVKLWRTKDFPADAPHSRVEITFLPVAGGTRVALFHSDIPEGQAARYESGWEERYFSPMREYFRKRSLAAQPKASPKPSAKLQKRKARGKAKTRGSAKVHGGAKARGKAKARRGMKPSRTANPSRSVKAKAQNKSRLKHRTASKLKRRK